MGKDTGIEWTHHTANFWWGCQKVSPGCKNCYAETLSNRYGKSIWGPPSNTDRELKKGVWKDILKWDKEAKLVNERRRVFVQSMSDFLEDHPQVYKWREDAIKIIEQLEWLDVLLLTKRPENASLFLDNWTTNWPSHVWLGTSVENQEQADKRIPHLIDTNAKVKFLSCEPLLGAIDLNSSLGGTRWIGGQRGCNGTHVGIGTKTCPKYPHHHHDDRCRKGIGWVICGGESGHNARPMYRG